MRLALFIATVLAAAAPALAQDRPVEMREALIGLTRVLGESHALRQACEGASDQHWRGRMNRLVETEQPDEDLDAKMKASFHAGFAEGRRLYPICSDGSRRALALAAIRGRELSTTLAHAKYRSGVMPVEPEAAQVTAEPEPR